MGADIAAHYRAGREIIVVQVTDGAESGVRAEMCAQKGICLTVAEIVAARNSEQLAAMQHLAPTARIEYANLPDASLTVATASALIAKYVARYPTASFETMSWLDDHPTIAHSPTPCAACARAFPATTADTSSSGATG